MIFEWKDLTDMSAQGEINQPFYPAPGLPKPITKEERKMNDRLENKLTMYRAVETLLDNNTAKTGPVAALAAAITNFKNLIMEIENAEQERINATAGKTVSKTNAESLLISEAITIAAALKALGSVTNDPELVAIGSATKSSLIGTRDTDLSTQTRRIYESANGNAVALADYGITPAMITSLQTRIADFDAALGTREESVSLRVAAGQELENFFKQADDILMNQTDKMMELFRTSDTQFYNEYKNARVIRDL